MGRKPLTFEQKKMKDGYDCITHLITKRPEYTWVDLQDIFRNAKTTCTMKIVEENDGTDNGKRNSE